MSNSFKTILALSFICIGLGALVWLVRNPGVMPTRGLVIVGQEGTKQESSKQESAQQVEVKEAAASPVLVEKSLSQAAGSAPTCHLITFKHRVLASHQDGEACTHHQNLLTLPVEQPRAESLCVRVNGRAVAFQKVKGKANQIVIGAIAGPSSKITVRYCEGSVACPADCKIEKDAFLSAIGSDDEGADLATTQEEKHLDHELVDLQALLAGTDSQGGSSTVFQGWVSEAQPVTQTCGRNVAGR